MEEHTEVFVLGYSSAAEEGVSGIYSIWSWAADFDANAVFQSRGPTSVIPNGRLHVSFVKIGKAKMGEQNTFKGHEQTLNLKVWRASGANA